MARALYCTYPVPLHAHTHFLAAVWPALVLHRVGGQALAAPLLLADLRLAQDLRHALLMGGVQTLMDKGRRVNGEGFNKASGNTQGSERNRGGGFTSQPAVSCQTVWGIHYTGEGKSPSNSRVGAGGSLPQQPPPRSHSRSSRLEVPTVGWEAIPAFWTSWRLPPACRQPHTCPAACRERPGSSGWWSPWGCRNKADDVTRKRPPSWSLLRWTPDSPVHFAGFVPAAVFSKRGTVLLLPLEERSRVRPPNRISEAAEAVSLNPNAKQTGGPTWLLTLLCSSLSSACIHMGLFSSAEKHQTQEVDQTNQQQGGSGGV